MYAILETLLYVLQIYWWIVIAAVVMSWLINYGVINRYNRFANGAADVLDRLTEPALRPIRRVVPAFGGVDISPMILLIIIYFLERLIAVDLFRALATAY